MHDPTLRRVFFGSIPGVFLDLFMAVFLGKFVVVFLVYFVRQIRGCISAVFVVVCLD
jgi:hypothetical protein